MHIYVNLIDLEIFMLTKKEIFVSKFYCKLFLIQGYTLFMINMNFCFPFFKYSIIINCNFTISLQCITYSIHFKQKYWKVNIFHTIKCKYMSLTIVMELPIRGGKRVVARSEMQLQKLILSYYHKQTCSINREANHKIREQNN